MPPKKAKKKASKPIVGEYDIDLMNAKEMKMYVEALKEEHQRMRKYRNLYHEDKREVLNFLKCIQEKIIGCKEVVIQKDVEIQQLMWDSDKKVKHEDQLNKMIESDYDKKSASGLLNSFITTKLAEILHKDEEQDLMKDIIERDREIHHMKYLYELLFAESDESKIRTHTDFSDNSRINFENCLTEYIKKVRRTFEEFSQSKIDAFSDIFEDDMNEENCHFADFIQKMSDYFNDIYWKNLKKKKEDLDNLTKLSKELKAITLTLNNVQKENEELFRPIINPTSPCNIEATTPTFSSAKLKALEEITYENDLLTVKLQMVTNEYKDLKEKFISSFRRIQQNAIYKTLLLEKKLPPTHNGPESTFTL